MKKGVLLLVSVLLISLVVSTTGCAEKQVSLTPTLGVRNVKVCSDVRGDRNYTIQPDATFKRGDRVWLYFEVRGITSEKVDDRFEVWTKFTDLKLYDPNNDTIEHLTNVAELHETISETTPNYTWFYACYPGQPDDLVGQYRFEFIVKDELSGAIGKGSATFTLK